MPYDDGKMHYPTEKADTKLLNIREHIHDNHKGFLHQIWPTNWHAWKCANDDSTTASTERLVRAQRFIYGWKTGQLPSQTLNLQWIEGIAYFFCGVLGKPSNRIGALV
jgi:hypothetical protein